MPQKLKRLIGIAMMSIFALYYANITLFYHGHIINGVTIVHSHFYGKNHAQADTHTISELTLISVLSAFQSGQPVLFFTGLAVLLLLSAILLQVPEKKAARRTVLHYSLRAPPALY